MDLSHSFPFKAVIFDCDGTLIDSEGSHFYAWQQVVLKRNHFFSLEDYIYCMGNANPSIAKMIAAKINASSAEELLAESKGYYHEHAKTGQKAIAHTVALALELAKVKEKFGIKLAVASAGKKEEILYSLKKLGIDHIFDAIVSGQDDLYGYSDPNGVNKPSPYIYQHTAKLLGVETGSCIVIEDSLPGLTAGVKAGCFTIAIPTLSTKIQDFSIADIQLKSFENISLENFFDLVKKKSEQKTLKNVPTVIFLNETSSAGKTTMVQCLQEKLDKPFLHIGIDHFLFMFPDRYRMDGSESHLGYRFERHDDQEGAKVMINKGAYGIKMNEVMRKSMKDLLSQGFNLIIYEVLFAEDDFQGYLELLKDYKVYFVAVKPPLEVAEKREKVRGGRLLGLARGLYNITYGDRVYDIEIDTSTVTPEEACNAILTYIQNNPDPQALKENIKQHQQLPAVALAL